MRWLPDKVMLFEAVVIDLYSAVTECCFLMNALTLLYIMLPSGET